MKQLINDLSRWRRSMRSCGLSVGRDRSSHGKRTCPTLWPQTSSRVEAGNRTRTALVTGQRGMFFIVLLFVCVCFVFA